MMTFTALFMVLGVFLLVILAVAGLLLLFQRRSLISNPSTDLTLLREQMNSLRLEMKQDLESTLGTVQQRLDAFQSGLDRQLGNNTEVMQRAQGEIGRRLGDAAQLVGEVRQQLGGVMEQQKQIFEVSKEISGLQEILQAPKLRGGLGELLLDSLLSQVLPRENYTIQYSFRHGEKVDAVIHLREGMVPIDSKFPLENFRRLQETSSEEERKRFRKELAQDLKIHIDTISKKYILPDEGTCPFALMYIPVEGIYYETTVREEIRIGEKSLASYARERNVFLVSPQSLYLYLSTIAMGLKGLKIEARAEEILRHIDRLQGELERFGEEFRKIGIHLQNARSSYEKSEKRLSRFQERLEINLPEESASSAKKKISSVVSWPSTSSLAAKP